MAAITEPNNYLALPTNELCSYVILPVANWLHVQTDLWFDERCKIPFFVVNETQITAVSGESVVPWTVFIAFWLLHKMSLYKCFP